jgi:hypothetical protein
MTPTPQAVAFTRQQAIRATVRGVTYAALAAGLNLIAAGFWQGVLGERPLTVTGFFNGPPALGWFGAICAGLGLWLAVLAAAEFTATSLPYYLKRRKLRAEARRTRNADQAF